MGDFVETQHYLDALNALNRENTTTTLTTTKPDEKAVDNDECLLLPAEWVAANVTARDMLGCLGRGE